MQVIIRLIGANPYVARAEVSNYGNNTIYHNLSIDSNWKPIEIDNIQVTNGQIDIGFYVDSPGGTILQMDDVKLIKN